MRWERAGEGGVQCERPVRAKLCARMRAGESLQCERLVLVSPNEALLEYE